MKRAIVNLAAICLIGAGMACQTSKPLGAEHPFSAKRDGNGKIVKVTRHEQMRRSTYYNGLQYKGSHKIVY